MSRTVTIRSLPQAFRTIKEMRIEGDAWGEDYHDAPEAVRHGLSLSWVPATIGSSQATEGTPG